MQKETALKIRVLRRLKAIPNVWLLKTQEIARSGTPDILMCLGGKFVALELKTDEGVVSKLQEYNLTKIQESGGIAIILTPSNLDSSIQFLANLTKGEKSGKRSGHKKCGK